MSLLTFENSVPVWKVNAITVFSVGKVKYFFTILHEILNANVSLKYIFKLNHKLVSSCGAFVTSFSSKFHY